MILSFFRRMGNSWSKLNVHINRRIRIINLTNPITAPIHTLTDLTSLYYISLNQAVTFGILKAACNAWQCFSFHSSIRYKMRNMRFFVIFTTFLWRFFFLLLWYFLVFITLEQQNISAAHKLITQIIGHLLAMISTCAMNITDKNTCLLGFYCGTNKRRQTISRHQRACNIDVWASMLHWCLGQHVTLMFGATCNTNVWGSM